MRQFAWATFDSYASSVLAIVSIAVIGRILTPDEIGVFSTASVFVGIATVLRDFGVSNYLIQARALDQHRINAVFLVAQALAFIASALLCLLAYPLVIFYSEPRLMAALLGLAINLLLIPKISIALALLRREMRFDSLVSVTFFMAVGQNVGGIIFALVGAGYMSMVYGSLLSSAIGFWLASRRHLHISFAMDPTVYKDVLSFGILSSGINVLRDMRSYLNEVVLAKSQGMAMVAYQAKAFSVMGLFWRSVMPGVYSFALPHFAKALRDGGKIEATFLDATEKTMAVALPALVFLAVEGDALILLLNGPQWGVAAEVGRLVPAIYLIGFPLLALVGTMLVASGHMKDLAKIQAYTLPAKIAVVLLVMYKPLGVFIAATVFVEMFVEGGLFAHFLRRRFCIGIGTLYRTCISSYGIAACFAVSIAVFRYAFELVSDNSVLRLILQAAFAVAVWLACIRLFSSPLQYDITRAWIEIRARFRAGRNRP